MTVALGMIAADGIVIAADRQETEGDSKRSQNKIESLWVVPGGSFIVSGAGTSSYLDSMATRLKHCFGESEEEEWESLESDSTMTERFRQVHAAFYSESVLPFAGYQQHERPDYELLFGCSVKKKHLLWYSDKLVLNQVRSPFRAVGIGANAAEALLKKFYVLRLPLKVAVSLAAFVIYQVKNSVEGCGFETDVTFTQENLPPRRVSAQAIKEMEDSFDRYRLIERDQLYQCIGGGLVPMDRKAKNWKKLLRDLSKPFQGLYKAMDEHRPKPSASQKSEQVP